LIYHPDKQKEVESKRNAEMLFAKIKKAYDGFPNLTLFFLDA
jgi:DnaJ-class molecular chaperone